MLNSNLQILKDKMFEKITGNVSDFDIAVLDNPDVIFTGRTVESYNPNEWAGDEISLLLFFNKKEKEYIVIDLSCLNDSYNLTFPDNYKVIIKEIKNNRDKFYLINFTSIEMEILKREIDEMGLKTPSFSAVENQDVSMETQEEINQIYSDQEYHENWDLYSMRFKNKADSAAFQLRFAKIIK
jgi:hypothetical protein